MRHGRRPRRRLVMVQVDYFATIDYVIERQDAVMARVTAAVDEWLPMFARYVDGAAIRGDAMLRESDRRDSSSAARRRVDEQRRAHSRACHTRYVC